MADEKQTMKKLDSIFDHLDRTLAEHHKMSSKLTRSLQELNDAGVNKLIKSMREQLKLTGAFNSAAIDLIKDANSLGAALDKLEDHYADIKKAEAKVEKQRSKILNEYGKDHVKAAKVLDKLYQEELKKLKLTTKQANAIEDTINNIKDASEQLRKEAKAAHNVSNFGKNLKKNSIVDWFLQKARGLIEVDKGFHNLASAMNEGIDQWVKLSKVGLQGTFVQVQKSALSLGVTFDEFSDMIAKNRGLINQLGGGADGVQRFSDMLKRQSAELEPILGPKNARIATSEFMTNLQQGGVNVMSQAGQSAVKNMTANWIKMAKEFGDEPKVFADMIKQQLEDETVTNRLIAAGKDHTAAIMAEIQARSENEKQLGLSTQQLIEFNKRVNQALNPETTDIQKDQTDAIRFKTAMTALQRKGLISDKDAQSVMPALQQYFQGNMQGFNQALDKGGREGLAKVFAGFQRGFNSQGPDRLPMMLGLQAFTKDNELYNIAKGTAPIDIAASNGTQLKQLTDNMSPESLKAFNTSLDDATTATGAFADKMRDAVKASDYVKAANDNVGGKLLKGAVETGLGVGTLLGGKTLIKKALANTRIAKYAGALLKKIPGGAAAAEAIEGLGGGTLGRVAGFALGAGGTAASLMAYSPDLGQGEDKYLAGKQGLSAIFGDVGKKYGVSPVLLNEIATQESSLNPSAHAKTSTASGLFQFTEGTWTDMIKKYGAKAGINTAGMSPQQILALRNNPRIATIMESFFLLDNQKSLGAKTAGQMYLGHFLGAGGASRVLSANPNAPIASAVSAKAFKANASLFNKVKTVGGLEAWADNKFGGALSPEVLAAQAAAMGGKAPNLTPPTGPDDQAEAAQAAQAAASATGAPTSQDPQAMELQKQTALLAQIAANTTGRSPSIVPPSQRGITTRRDAAEAS